MVVWKNEVDGSEVDWNVDSLDRAEVAVYLGLVFYVRGIMNLQKVMSTSPNMLRLARARLYIIIIIIIIISSLYIKYYYYSSSTTHFAPRLLSAVILQNHFVITGVFVYFDFFLSWRF